MQDLPAAIVSLNVILQVRVKIFTSNTLKRQVNIYFKQAPCSSAVSGYVHVHFEMSHDLVNLALFQDSLWRS